MTVRSSLMSMTFLTYCGHDSCLGFAELAVCWLISTFKLSVISVNFDIHFQRLMLMSLIIIMAAFVAFSRSVLYNTW